MNNRELLNKIKRSHGRLCCISAWLLNNKKPKAANAIKESNALLFDLIQKLELEINKSFKY